MLRNRASVMAGCNSGLRCCMPGACVAPRTWHVLLLPCGMYVQRSVKVRGDDHVQKNIL
jgi:hypothetical protein